MKNIKRQFGLGTWITSGSSIVTEIVSSFGFDWLLFDTEHGCMPEAVLLQNMQAVKGEARIIVRVGRLDEHYISRALDWGADGIMLPHVSTPEQVKRCVKAMNFPPYGERGYSSSARCFDYGNNSPEDLKSFDRPLLMVQIEDYPGVKNIRQIASIEEIDVLFVGPSDLRLDLSMRPETESFDFDEALKIVSKAAAEHGKQSGILVRDNRDLPKLYEIGYTAIAAGSDLGILRKGYQDLMKIFNNN